MAYTVTKTPAISGNERVMNLRISADAATQTIETGHGLVTSFEMGIISMTTTASYHVAYNSNASGINSNGVLGLSGFSSGDELWIRVYGR